MIVFNNSLSNFLVDPGIATTALGDTSGHSLMPALVSFLGTPHFLELSRSMSQAWAYELYVIVNGTLLSSVSKKLLVDSLSHFLMVTLETP